MQNGITAIPTIGPRGIQFRSRLEARWASFFDFLGWEWKYEDIDLKGYIPDFMVKPTGVDKWILFEVKPEIEYAGLKQHFQKIIDSGWTGPFIVVGVDLFRHGDGSMLIGNGVIPSKKNCMEITGCGCRVAGCRCEIDHKCSFQCCCYNFGVANAGDFFEDSEKEFCLMYESLGMGWLDFSGSYCFDEEKLNFKPPWNTKIYEEWVRIKNKYQYISKRKLIDSNIHQVTRMTNTSSKIKRVRPRSRYKEMKPWGSLAYFDNHESP